MGKNGCVQVTIIISLVHHLVCGSIFHAAYEMVIFALNKMN